MPATMDGRVSLGGVVERGMKNGSSPNQLAHQKFGDKRGLCGRFAAKFKRYCASTDLESYRCPQLLCKYLYKVAPWQVT